MIVYKDEVADVIDAAQFLVEKLGTKEEVAWPAAVMVLVERGGVECEWSGADTVYDFFKESGGFKTETVESLVKMLAGEPLEVREGRTPGDDDWDYEEDLIVKCDIVRREYP